MGFWQNVDNELAYLGMSRKELAAEAQFDVSYINKGIERNGIPIADTALRIARALHVSLDYLLDMENPDELEKKTKCSDAGLSDDDRKALKAYRKYRTLIEGFEQLPQKGQDIVVQLMESLQAFVGSADRAISG